MMVLTLLTKQIDGEFTVYWGVVEQIQGTI